MKYLKSYNESLMMSDEIYQTIQDMSLDLVDNGIQVDIKQGDWVDIVVWKHKGDEWHIPYKFDNECLNFLLSLNNYMISNDYTLMEVCIVPSGSVPNSRFNMLDPHVKVKGKKITIKQILDLIDKSFDTVEEVSITYKK